MKYGQLYWQSKVHAFSLLEVEGGSIRSLCGKVRVRYPAYWQDSLVRSKGDFEARPCKSCKRLYLKIAAADALGE